VSRIKPFAGKLLCMGLEMTEYVLCVEEEFNIRFPEELLEKTATVGEFYVLVCDLLEKDPTSEPSVQIIWNKLVALLAAQEAIPPERIRFDSHFFRDLGMG